MSPFAAHLLHWEMHCKIYETGKSIEVSKSKNLDIISLTLQLPIIVIIIILVFHKATIFIYSFPLQLLAYSQCICHLGHNLWQAVIPGTTSPTVVERVQLRSGNGNGIGYGYGYEVGMGSSSAYDMFIEFAPYMPEPPLQLQLHSRCRCAT